MDQLEEIKKRIDIVDLISQYINLKKAGRNFKAICPFHQEKTPSFVVSPERQIWHCFGSCGEGGDIFGFLMKMENLDFSEAVRELAKRAGIKLTQFHPKKGEKRKQIWYEANHLAGEFYHYLLTDHSAGKKARDYILGRGISKESLKFFKIGFSPNSWSNLQKFLIGKKKYLRTDLENTGLIARSDSGRFYDRFRSRIMFPLKDHRGNICGFSGRILLPDVKEAKYINTPETPLYHKSDLLYGLFEAKEAIKEKDEVILVEGELDVISSYQVGVKNVVAIKGSALTENQVKLLGRFTKNIVLALDQDMAGDQAARRGIGIADKEEMNIKVAELKKGKDPDEIAQKDPKLWKKLIKGAVPVYDYFIDSAFNRFDGDTIEGKRNISQEIIPILSKANNEIIQAHYARLLAERLKVTEESILEEIDKQENSPLTSYEVSPSFEKEAEKKSRREKLENYLFSLAFQSDRWELLKKRKIQGLIKTYRLERILETLKKYLKKYKSIESSRLAKMLDPELLDTLNKFYLSDLGETVEDEEKLDKEFSKTLDRLEDIDLREKLSEISGKIKRLEKEDKISSKEQKKLDKLYFEFRDLSKKLSEFEKE